MIRLALAVLCSALSATAAPAAAKFTSKTVSANTPGRVVQIDVELDGSKDLYLVVTDGGDGYGCDWANWIAPRLVAADGRTTRPLTALKWTSAKVGWGEPHVGRSAGGQPMRVDGKPVTDGIGVHANSVLHYEIPPGFARFRASAAIDDGGADQGCGSTVKFLVYTEKPPADVLAAKPAAGGDLGRRGPADALAGLDVHEELQAEVFAAEPHFSNPTNIDVDHLGRVWVCEVVNYRRFRNKRHPERTAGDRILVLQDTDADGVADAEATRVFYQGRDVDSAHGICVLPTPSGKGTRALVSCGDSVFYLIDDDGDLKADRKEILFTGISGTQHDHGIHAFVFGPDGRLYFNFGNAGKQLKDKHGKPIVDEAGNVVNDSRKPYQEGMVFRCNLDGSELETLGWNFRNNWEVCVDSFGGLWQSDNDDDGNRGVRINFVMEFGNYGYKDELTGAGWRSPRTGMHAEVPKRHWHLNDPGVVPNLLQTGAGSPTGICVYEGDLLPRVFRNQVIHCDAGPNVVRAYPVTPNGAGYTATIVNVLEGTRDKWFRPSDVCVAPDGSLLVADWYDPGVGGHAMGDVDRGRLFRVTPKGHAGYRIPKVDVSTAEGAVAALQSPNLATRYLGWTALNGMGADAESALKTLWTNENPRLRARALWLLAQLDDAYIESALKDPEPNVRIAGLRAARHLESSHVRAIEALVDDESVAVRRECAIALRDVADEETVARLWSQLARAHDGKDRWFLEALGNAARGRWDACIAHWMKSVGDEVDSPAGRDILWRSRSRFTPAGLASSILDPETRESDRIRYFRGFDFLPSSDGKSAALVSLVLGDHPDQARITALALTHGAKVDASDPKVKTAIDRSLKKIAGTAQFVAMVEQLKLVDRYPDLLALARQHPADELGVRAIGVLMNANQHDLINASIAGEERDAAIGTIEVVGNSGNGKAVNYLLPLLDDDERPLARRRAAVASLAKVRNGAARLVNKAEKKQLPSSLEQATAVALHSAQWADVKAKANKLFPPPPSKNNKPLPPLADLIAMGGDAKLGRVLFNTTATCTKCHRVGGFGKEVGPDLSEIGKKLSRQALFQSILYPSAGISHNYETYVVVLESGNVLNGIITSRTEERVTIKGADAIAKTFKTSEIDEIIKQPISLMPADLQKVMTAQELVDVVEYLQTLKQKPKPAASK